ncbi:hypothetical protein PC129_g13697 [Phytophthora cactorum]|uniref:Uncharacterized protein n=1 Tax=Phytophthora cactorum TaxID=29920 RepID=A0A8T1K6C1_9STRA|nr:hypothetical protein Pcac1_g10851 [Phytophthora cactorum]KAG2806323.1 hypothetical protein PC112_g17897 [Phytophthora cactorum]KAG2887264.1 hypothetical protein PC114_g18877 [Phytophthora cactorum]KAG2898853.1 hypothetical protein PC115_g16720 [Phytophthora cactorum]KAG2911918.1 hypothetical protein PC117_g19042 [Phytophthora cactorum]
MHTTSPHVPLYSTVAGRSDIVSGSSARASGGGGGSNMGDSVSPMAILKVKIWEYGEQQKMSMLVYFSSYNLASSVVASS